MSEMLIEGLKQGEINGLVVQNPVKMGYLGVKTMIQLLRSEPIEKRIDTGVYFIELKDLEKEEIHELINPDLDKWLKHQ